MQIRVRKKYLPFVLTLSLFVLVAGSGFAQGQFQASGDLRARSEYRHGFSTPLTDEQKAAFFIDQRSRLIFDYKQTNYILKLSLQDVRVWGSQPQLTRNSGSLTALHEGWGQVFFSDAFSLKVGRQEINLNDQRIFGAVDWLMQARAHDAAMLRYKKDALEIQGTVAFNQDGIQTNSTFYTVANNYKAMQYLWMNQDFKNFSASLLFLNNGRQGGTPDEYETFYSQTVGPRLGYKTEKLKANLTVYGQYGKEPDAVTKIDASYFAFDLAYKLNTEWTVTPGVELLSGNDQYSPGKNNAFTPFYGTNHKFNGLMDYFYVGNHINSVGLHDYYTYVDYRKNKFSGSAQLHYFQAPGNVIDPENNLRYMNRYLGVELDLVFQYRFSEQITFDAGYSRFLPTSTLIALKGGDKSTPQQWAWLMLSFKPVFYKTPEEKNP